MVTPCDACGEDAVIRKVKYKYSVDGPPGQPASAHVLRETHQDIECPNCGLRTVVQIHPRPQE